MLSNFLEKKIISHLSYTPNQEQESLIESIANFLFSKETNELFLLKGYAGTGKTSIMGAVIKSLDELQQKAILMAPTGRAAKVFSSYASHPAFTIHKKIYRQKSATEFSFGIMDNLHKHTLFIVDEASMINNSSAYESAFGSGNLLQDLITYVYSGEGCRLLLLGDEAQLPPVGQSISDAMDEKALGAFGFEVRSFQLKEVVRQSEQSGILHNATIIRNKLEGLADLNDLKLDVKSFPDIVEVTGSELIEEINTAYNRHGIENCIVINRSNKRATIYNRGIRNQVLQKEEELSSGDLLMVNKNNYFWNKKNNSDDFIANGDILEVVRVRKHYHIYNLHFADVSLRFLDYELEIDARILVDSLHAETPADMAAINKQLFESINEDYHDIGNKRLRMKKVMENEFFNALQVKFAYAITCHKAQGGQWEQVFIDLGNIPEELDSDFYHWLYTAITRASKKLYLVNFPSKLST